jgi:hypothetical protein
MRNEGLTLSLEDDRRQVVDHAEDEDDYYLPQPPKYTFTLAPRENKKYKIKHRIKEQMYLSLYLLSLSLFCEEHKEEESLYALCARLSLDFHVFF